MEMKSGLCEENQCFNTNKTHKEKKTYHICRDAFPPAASQQSTDRKQHPPAPSHPSRPATSAFPSQGNKHCCMSHGSLTEQGL